MSAPCAPAARYASKIGMGHPTLKGEVAIKALCLPTRSRKMDARPARSNIENDDGKIRPGGNIIIEHLAKEGYGTYESLKMKNIREFFDIRVESIRGKVHELRAHKKKDHEIAELLNISIDFTAAL